MGIEKVIKSCPVCQANKYKKIGNIGKFNKFHKNYYEDLKDVSEIRCQECDLIYMYPSVNYSDDLLSNLYSMEYFSTDGKVKEIRNMSEKREIIKKAAKYMDDPKGKKLLDVGCGLGGFLIAGNECGMDVLGLDINKTVTDYINKTFGFKVINSYLTEDAFEENTFDVVILSHVVEHLQDPSVLLKIIHRVLKPGGLFIMAMPNADAFLNHTLHFYNKLRRGSKKSFLLQPFAEPYHINGFNRKSAIKLLSINEFNIRDCYLHHGLDWNDNKGKIFVKAIKFIGLLLNKGVEIVTISQK